MTMSSPPACSGPFGSWRSSPSGWSASTGRTMSKWTRRTSVRRTSLTCGATPARLEPRVASDLLPSEVAQVLAANGVKVFVANAPTPTQVATFAILDKATSGGLVITASHNPYYFSGLKYKPEYAGSASPEVTARLEEEIEKVQRGGPGRPGRFMD